MRNNSYDGSDVHIAAVAASEIPDAMEAGRQYELRATSTAGAWFRIVVAGGAGAAVATDGSHYLPAGQAVRIAAIANRDRVSVIREAAADATVVLSEIAETQR